ncbi:MAG: DUF1573 domain-containing protein [Bacteroidota bacterium]
MDTSPKLRLKLLWFGAIISVGTFWMIAQNHLQSKGRLTQLKVLTSVIDLGEIANGQPAIGEFYILNNGSNPLEIYQVDAGCTCTSSDWQRDIIAPGDTTTIKVLYEGLSPGYFYQVIQFKANANPEIHVLSLKGKIPGLNKLH